MIQKLRNRIIAGGLAVCFLGSPAWAQSGSGGFSVPSSTYQLTKTREQVEMVVNTSMMIELDREINTAIPHNAQMVNVRPMSGTKMLVEARSTGVTHVDFIDENGQEYRLELMILGDARELAAILKAEFPTSTINVRPIQNGVILSGFVTNDVHVEQVDRISQQYFPEVINRVNVGGPHTVILHTKVLEVSRTKLRELGVDWQFGFGDDFIGQSLGVLGGGATSAGAIVPGGTETFRYGVLNDGNSFFNFIRALRENNLVKVMADPTVVAEDGRPASFNSGGEFPIIVPSGLGQVGIEFREFGTKVDFIAKVRGNGKIWLEVRPTISELDPSRSVTLGGISVPGLRSRYVETAVELNAGQTLALAGLLQLRTETQSVGLPGLADVPYVGALFRRNLEVQNEVELLITVTPDFAGAMDPDQVPAIEPGMNSMSPTDTEFYLKGYMEVPNVCGTPGCTGCTECGPQAAMQGMQPPMMYDGSVISESGYQSGEYIQGAPITSHPQSVYTPSLPNATQSMGGTHPIYGTPSGYPAQQYSSPSNLQPVYNPSR